MQARTRQQGVQSVEVGVRLLRALASAGAPAMLKELAQTARMPPAKAHRYLVSLARSGLVEQHSVSGLYDLGPFALELGLCALGRLSPVAAAEAYLLELRGAIGQTVALAVWSERGPVIASWFGLDAPVSATLRVGSTMPATRSATGLAFLSFLADAGTADLIKHELAENRRAGLAPRGRAELDEALEKTRRRGYASTGDFIPGIAGIAAPVFDRAGAMTLAVVALGYTQPFKADLDHIAASTLRTARALSARLGWKGPAA
jgi:DNA-binding IclR family transcriptional regulator